MGHPVQYLYCLRVLGQADSVVGILREAPYVGHALRYVEEGLVVHVGHAALEGALGVALVAPGQAQYCFQADRVLETKCKYT